MAATAIIVKTPLEINQENTFFRLDNFLTNVDVLLKLEGLNLAGSIKLKPAIAMLENLEAKGLINPIKNRIIESSSGNLGIALSMACKVKGYKFICVSDPNINAMSQQYIQLYGARLIIVKERDQNGGFLSTRINLINTMLQQDSDLVWLNQYSSETNPSAHFATTAKEIFTNFKELDYLFIGVGTGGTIMGCANYIQQHGLKTKIIAIDAEGSVSFGYKPKQRKIPGIGTSRKPEILKTNLFNDVLLVPEQDTVKMCYEILNKYGLLIGGSSGSVLAGIRLYPQEILQNKTIVAISPDFGDRYLDTIFNRQWVEQNFPNLVNQL